MRLKFSLRYVFVLLATLSVLLSLVVMVLRETERERQAVQQISQLPGGVFHESFYFQSPFRDGKPAAKSLLDRILASLGCQHVVYVYLGSRYFDSGQEHGFVRLHQNISDQDVDEIEKLLIHLPYLRRLNLTMTRISQRGVERLQKSLPNVEIEFDKNNNNGYIPIILNAQYVPKNTDPSSPRFESADLREAEFRAEDLELLRNVAFSEIRSIDLRGTSINDEGLKYLEGIASLEELFLENTLVTRKAVKNFRKLHPRCRVTF